MPQAGPVQGSPDPYAPDLALAPGRHDVQVP